MAAVSWPEFTNVTDVSETEPTRSTNATVAPLANPEPLTVTEVPPEVVPDAGTMLVTDGPVGATLPLKMHAEGPVFAAAIRELNHSLSVRGWNTRVAPPGQPRRWQ